LLVDDGVKDTHAARNKDDDREIHLLDVGSELGAIVGFDWKNRRRCIRVKRYGVLRNLKINPLDVLDGRVGSTEGRTDIVELGLKRMEFLIEAFFAAGLNDVFVVDPIVVRVGSSVRYISHFEYSPELVCSMVFSGPENVSTYSKIRVGITRKCVQQVFSYLNNMLANLPCHNLNADWVEVVEDVH